MIGEFFGATHDFEYNIGDKLYEFTIISYEDFDKLKTMYTQLIELVCSAKEANIMDEKLDCFFKMFQIVRACLEFYEELEENPYTIELILHEFTDNIEKVSTKKHNEYMKYFETIRDSLIENFMDKKTDLKK